MHPVIRILMQVAETISYVMRISTSTTLANYCRYMRAGLINSSKITVFECTVKCETSGSATGSNMELSNGARYTDLAIKTNSIICNAYGSSPYTHTMDTTSAYHAYKMKFIGTTNCEYYVDNTLVHTATYANMSSDAGNYIYFGDIMNTANMGGSMLWKSVRYNLDFGANPENFVEWDSSSLPSTQGWTAQGTESFAIIITE